ncbi:MAG: hypothetical protein ACRDQB_10820 [Thermocrispum sp.]
MVHGQLGEDRGPDHDFAKDVERERKKYQKEKKGGFLDTPITRKLAGGR